MTSGNAGNYLLGETYETLAGEFVTIMSVNEECVLGSDGVWRYDHKHKLDSGRTTGTSCFPPDVKNFKKTAWLKHASTIAKIMQGFEPGGRSGPGFDTMKAQKRTAIALDALLEKVHLVDVFEVFDRLEKI
jgi:hypothetical protein